MNLDMDFAGFGYNPEYTSLHNLFKRCKKCGDDSPSCPTCKDGETCSFIAKSCNTCQSAKCIPASEANLSPQKTHHGPKTNIGAIAGGIAGGIVFIVVISFLLWKFCLKGKRRPISEAYEFAEEKPPQNPFGMHRSGRLSTHTVQSMASTVLTRASNIIQIAYIPGVTNRQTASPGMLVPPVPPIPSATPATSPYRDHDGDQVFFTAGDIRDSSYSSETAYTGALAPYRDSVSPSLARSSITSALYKATAQVSPLPAPTQTMQRGNVKVVNVTSNPSSATQSPIDGPQYYTKQIQAAGSSRTVQVRMPASTDALGGLSQSNSVRTLRGKPVPLNIRKQGLRRGADTPLASSIADAISRAAQDDPQGHHRFIRASVADSMESHSRGLRLDEIEAEDESTDDDMAGNAHERSRRSLLRPREQQAAGSPFGDGHRVTTSAEEVPMLQSFDLGGNLQGQRIAEEAPEKKGPFEDTHAV